MIALPADATLEREDGLVLRRARRGELEAIHALLRQLHEDPPPVDDRVRAAFDEVLGAPWRMPMVAELEGTLVGTLDLFVLDNLTRGGRPWAGIENFVVDAEHRAHGIGDAMLDFAVRLAREVGCYKVQLISHDVHEPAHGFYRRRAFDAPVQGFRRYLNT